MSDAAHASPFAPPGAPPRPGDAAPRHGVESDPRADGRRRHVELRPDRIVLERRLAGMAMRIGLPATAYRGVSLSVVIDDELLVPQYEIALRHADADLCARLALIDDREAAFAALEGWAQWFSLPRLVERADGGFNALDASPAPARPGASRRPRPSRRRARFLTRRKPGRPERLAVSHAGAREIVSYE